MLPAPKDPVRVTLDIRHRHTAMANPPRNPTSFSAMFLDEGFENEYKTTYDHDSTYKNPHISPAAPVPVTVSTSVSADNTLVKPHLSPRDARPLKNYVQPRAPQFQRGPEALGRRKFDPPPSTFNGRTV